MISSSGDAHHHGIARRPSAMRVLMVVFVAAFVLGLGGGLNPVSAGAGNDPAPIAPDRASALARAGGLLLIDVRSPREWRDTGIPSGARAITMHRAGGWPGFVDAVATAVEGDKTTAIALICASGFRSAWAARVLRAAGFTEIYDVSAGMFGRTPAFGEPEPGWLERGLSVEPRD